MFYAFSMIYSCVKSLHNARIVCRAPMFYPISNMKHIIDVQIIIVSRKFNNIPTRTLYTCIIDQTRNFIGFFFFSKNRIYVVNAMLLRTNGFLKLFKLT